MMVASVPNGHPAQQQQQQPFPHAPHGHPGNGQHYNPSPAHSNHSLPGPNGAMNHQQPPHPNQPMPYNGSGPYVDPNMYLHPHYNPQYPPQQPGPQFGNFGYYGPGQPHPQMGGPGPGTMHNGYNAYQQNGYMQRKPVTHMAPPPQHQPGPQQNGHDGMPQTHFNQFPPPGEGYYSHPSQPPPHFGQPDGQYQPNFYQPPQYPPHQPAMYPPDHPYNYGHGVGFLPQQPMHNGPNGHMYGDRPPPPQFQNVHHNRPAPTKSLNPSAQGFVYRPPTTQQSKPRDSQPASQQSFTPASNGSDSRAETAGEKVVPKQEQSDGGLGLSQMEPASAALTDSTVSRTSQTTNGMTPSMSQGSITSSSAIESSVKTPEGEHQSISDNNVTPTSDSVRLPPAPANLLPIIGKGFAFGSITKGDRETQIPAGQKSSGNAMKSIPSETTTIMAAQTPKAPVQVVKSEPKAIEVQPSTFTITHPEGDRSVRVVKGRPSHTSKAGVTFSAKMISRQRIDQSPVQHISIELEPVTEPRQRPRKAKCLVSMGTGNDTAARIVDPSLVFGEITVEEIPAIVLRSPKPQKPSIEAESSDDKVEASKSQELVEPAQTPAPAAVPKAKPSSWAALLKPKTQALAPSDNLSVGPSSVRVSPSKSVISLATETDAVTENEAVTPRSIAPSLPPSTGLSTAPGPRPAFNYAAAAASGKGLSPHDDLLNLLTQGIKGRSKVPSPNVPRGLINTGNLCYANTILQMLAYCSPFSELLEELGKRIPADLARRQPLLEALIGFLKEFTPGSTSGTSTPSDKSNGAAYKGKAKDKKYSASEAFIPETVYDALKGLSRFDALRRGQQEDAQEFLGWFIETLHEELLRIVSRTESSRSSSVSRSQGDEEATEIARPASPTDGWLEVGKKQKTNVVRNTETRESSVSRIFGGTLRSILHAPGQKDSVTLEPYQPIQLDIQSPNVKSITDALRQFNEPEPVPEYRSSKGGVVAATKQVFIETLPPVLILHLKRFVYDHVAHDSVKKNKPIAYGTELVIPPEIISPTKRTSSPVKYRLFGVDYHHGSSASGGHYTIAVARKDAKGWIHFDDETHSTIAEEDVIVSQEDADKGKSGLVGGREKCAYLLFYQRVR